MDPNRQKISPGKKDVQKERHVSTDLFRKLRHTENELELVTAKLKQVTEENSYLKSKIDKNEARWTELLCENERLRKYLQDLESANINVEGKSHINLHNSNLTSQIMKIEESSDDVLDINSLPNEMILKIFGYLEQNQLGQIASVCSKWNELTRSPALWKKVDVKFHWSHKSYNTVTNCFVNMLPSCVSSIRLYYSNNIDWTEQLNFEELCVRLQRRCPHLEILILECVHLTDNLPSVIGLCSHFLPGLRILIFHHSRFSDFPTREEFHGISKIEVLDVSDCSLRRLHYEIHFSKMPRLRVLNLRNTRATSKTFRSLRYFGRNLEELYLCGTFISESYLIFNKSMFPHLKIICLHCPLTIYSKIAPILQSCESLQKVYFHLRADLRSDPFFRSNRCKLEIVEVIAENRSHNVDYSYKTNKI